MNSAAVIRHIFISSGHNFFGHHGRPPGRNPAIAKTSVRCRAGYGIEGDRFYGYRPDYKGQITFFNWDVYDQCKREFDVPELQPDAFRRNVLVQGLDLNALIGRRFTLGGVEFEGTAEARPCFWMNTAVAPGAEDWLMGNGGLRARVLTDGELRVGPAEIWMMAEAATSPGFIQQTFDFVGRLRARKGA